jgi:hypothetical protein
MRACEPKTRATGVVWLRWDASMHVAGELGCCCRCSSRRLSPCRWALVMVASSRAICALPRPRMGREPRAGRSPDGSLWSLDQATRPESESESTAAALGKGPPLPPSQRLAYPWGNYTPMHTIQLPGADKYPSPPMHPTMHSSKRPHWECNSGVGVVSGEGQGGGTGGAERAWSLAGFPTRRIMALPMGIDPHSVPFSSICQHTAVLRLLPHVPPT